MKCNKCGKEFNVWDFQEYFTIGKSRCGYGTKFDGESVHINLCCKCFEELADSCVISPVEPEDTLPR